MKNKTVYSLGHSNLSMEQFIKFLKDLGVKHLLDIRSNPNSSYVPHFNKDRLEKVLNENQIGYTYCGERLGGRQSIPFKDYISTPQYQLAIKHIERIIDRGKSAIMCSEQDYNNCHREYISEMLLNHGYDVIQAKYDKNKQLNKQIPLKIEG